MSRIARPPDDLEEAFASCIRFLRRSAQHFDEGDESEASRMALELRKLLHHYGQSQAILDQLDLKRHIAFIHTANPGGGSRPHSSLAGLRIRPHENRFAPLLERAEVRQRLDFEAWWRATILTDAAGNRYTRERIVMTTADQDGGAHVDPGIDEEFYRLTRENAFGLEAGIPGHPIRPAGTPHRAIIRQVGFEVVESLRAGVGRLSAVAREALA